MKHTALLLSFSLLATAAWTAPDQTPEFYRRQGLLQGRNLKQDRAYAASLAQDLQVWLNAHPQDEQAKDTLLLQADYYLRAKDPARALMALYQVRYFFPLETDLPDLSQKTEQAAQQLGTAQVANALPLLAKAPAHPQDRTEAHAALLTALAGGKLSGAYEAGNELFDAFFAAYPDYENNDRLTLLYGDWHRQNGNFLAAITQYKKVHTLFPDTPYKAAALRLSADVYTGDLKDYPAAEALYKQVLADYPGSAEEGVVFKHLAVLEENRKNYPAALNYYEQAIGLLGTQETAFGAWTGKADVQQKTKQYKEAYNTLRGAAMVFAEDETNAISALLYAAQLAHKRLDSWSLQAQALQQITLHYPQARQMPEVLYQLGYAQEKLGQNTAAVQSYKTLIIRYPTDKYASRAQSRLAKLEK